MQRFDSRLALVVLLSLSGSCGTSDTPNGTAGPSNTPQVGVGSVSLTPQLATVLVGGTLTLAATVRDDAGAVLANRTVTWSSSDPGIASVSAGVVSGVAAGSATITATSGGKTALSSVAVGTGTGNTYVSVATGGAHTCALTAAGAAYCWGRGESGQLGIAPPTLKCSFDAEQLACSLVPVAVQGGIAFTKLTGGGTHTCGLIADGTAYCWGNNAYGQLGDGTTQARNTPTPVATTLKFSAIDGGGSHTCALTSAGVAYCWGKNFRGAVGDGSTTHRSSPTAVSGSLTFLRISAGGFEAGVGGGTCGVVVGGDIYCWGDNERGQLGNGTIDVNPHSIPTKVSGGLEYAVLTSGLGRHSCALTPTNSAYCWGENSFGALGNSSFTDASVPVIAGSGRKFAVIVAGGYIGHSCGLTDAGIAWCWGDNERGAVGDGTTIDAKDPVPVIGGLVFTSIDAGFRHNCAFANTGALYCWGSGAAGQLGTNSINASLLPAKVMGQP